MALDIKYNIYMGPTPQGPWTLMNTSPISASPDGKYRYVVPNVERNTVYYIRIVGGYYSGNSFKQLFSQLITNTSVNESLSAAVELPINVISASGINPTNEQELNHSFELDLISKAGELPHQFQLDSITRDSQLSQFFNLDGVVVDSPLGHILDMDSTVNDGILAQILDITAINTNSNLSLSFTISGILVDTNLSHSIDLSGLVTSSGIIHQFDVQFNYMTFENGSQYFETFESQGPWDSTVHWVRQAISPTTINTPSGIVIEDFESGWA
jgi:hypothetical protein